MLTSARFDGAADAQANRAAADHAATRDKPWCLLPMEAHPQSGSPIAAKWTTVMSVRLRADYGGGAANLKGLL